MSLSRRVAQKLSLRLTLIFYTQSIIPMARSSPRLSESGLKNVLKDSLPLRDRAKYAIKVCHDVNRAL